MYLGDPLDSWNTGEDELIRNPYTMRTGTRWQDVEIESLTDKLDSIKKERLSLERRLQDTDKRKERDKEDKKKKNLDKLIAYYYR